MMTAGSGSDRRAVRPGRDLDSAGKVNPAGPGLVSSGIFNRNVVSSKNCPFNIYFMLSVQIPRAKKPRPRGVSVSHQS